MEVEVGMKRQWNETELADSWSLTHDEFELLNNRRKAGRLGFAALMKFFQIEGRFPGTKNDIPRTALQYLAEQLNVSTNTFDDYSLKGRSAKRDRGSIRTRLGFRPVTVEDSKTLVEWLRTEVLPRDHKQEHIREAALEWCRRQKIEPPAALRLGE